MPHETSAEFSLIKTTMPPGPALDALVETLLLSRLAACIQVTEPVRSRYLWKGKLEESLEAILWIKTPAPLSEQILETLRLKHPYEVPEILVIHPDFVDPRYLAWAKESTGLDSP